MPRRRTTRSDGSLLGTATAITLRRPGSLKPNSSAACTASVANPWPQAARGRRQPVSTAGRAGRRSAARSGPRSPRTRDGPAARAATCPSRAAQSHRGNGARLGASLVGVQQGRKVAPRLRGGIHLGPGCEVAVAPLAQHPAPRMQLEPRREGGQRQRAGVLSARPRNTGRAPRRAIAARRRTRCGGRAQATARNSGSWRGRAACRGGESAPSRRPAPLQ